MHEEINVLNTNKTIYIGTQRSWYKLGLFKLGVQDEIKSWKNSNRYKVKLVSKGFSQIEGVDFKEIFSVAVKTTTIRVYLSILIG